MNMFECNPDVPHSPCCHYHVTLSVASRHHHSQNPLQWSYGIVKCPSYAYFRMLPDNLLCQILFFTNYLVRKYVISDVPCDRQSAL